MGCIEDALTIAAFSSVSPLYNEEPKDHEQKTEYEKTMGELIVALISCFHRRMSEGTSSHI